MNAETTGGEVRGNIAFNLLQQQLIGLRAQLDRQVSQLMRLNGLSNQLIGWQGDGAVAQMFTEAIVDVLDVAVGAVWILDEHQPADDRFGICGAPAAGAHHDDVADELSRALIARGMGGTVSVCSLGVDPLPGTVLIDALVCPGISRHGSVTAVLLAANSPTTAGMTEPVTEDTREMLAALAEKCAAHLDSRADRRVIEGQLEQLRESEERLELVLRGTNDGWWDWDLVSGTCRLSARWLQMLGHAGQQAMVRTGFWADLVHPEDRPAFEHGLEKALATGADSLEIELRLRCEDGSHLAVLARGTISRDTDGRPLRFAGSILDLTERKRHEADIHRLAYYDPLTDLPNRRLLGERLQHALTNREATGQITAILMLDLDRFKTLNDTHGHAAGDQLLRAVGRRLTSLVHHGDTVARLSGDEFVVLLENLGADAAMAHESVAVVANHVLTALNEPYVIDVGTLHHSASIGVTVADEPHVSVERLLQQADVALYQAKADGRNSMRVFHPSMQLAVDTRSALEARLRDGLARDEFAVVYQAQVDTNGDLSGAEALVRWFPADRDPVSPAEFIPVAEESGMIHQLGQWVLDTVCAQLAAWQFHAPPGFRVAVNLSAAEFLHPDFPARILSTLDRHQASGNGLRLEITEATVLTDLAFAAERMNLLRAHGIEFALDDFGTGYSSLTYLRRLPVDEVKIDRSYVRRMLEDDDDAAIVRTVITLCEALSLRVVAEGVETETQWTRLVEDHCRHFQGFLFGHPVPPPADVTGLIRPNAARRQRTIALPRRLS